MSPCFLHLDKTQKFSFKRRSRAKNIPTDEKMSEREEAIWKAFTQRMNDIPAAKNISEHEAAMWKALAQTSCDIPAAKNISEHETAIWKSAAAPSSEWKWDESNEELSQREATVLEISATIGMFLIFLVILFSGENRLLT